jgi:hypothetical protein
MWSRATPVTLYEKKREVPFAYYTIRVTYLKNFHIIEKYWRRNCTSLMETQKYRTFMCSNNQHCPWKDHRIVLIISDLSGKTMNVNLYTFFWESSYCNRSAQKIRNRPDKAKIHHVEIIAIMPFVFVWGTYTDHQLRIKMETPNHLTLKNGRVC